MSGCDPDSIQKRITTLLYRTFIVIIIMNVELCMFVSLYVSLRTVISLLLFGHAPEFYCDALIGRIDI